MVTLIIWSLAGSFYSPGYQDVQDTETPTLTPTDTELPSPTPSVTAAVSDVPTETPTETSTVAPPPVITFTAIPTVRTRATRTPLPEVVLSGEYVSDEVLVRFRHKAPADAINGCLHAAGATVESEIEDLSVLVLKVPDGRVGASMARLAACPDARMVEPNYLVHAADTIPSDPGWPQQYGLVNIHAPQGWDVSTGSPAVTIAIVDTGVDLGHPDLSAKIVAGHDFVNNDSVAQDDNGHGTHVAGIAAAISNNGTGVAGVSWGARIMPVKVLNAAGNGSFADVAAGMTWAADRGAQIMNLSLGGTSGSSVLQAAVEYAYSRGVVIVAAAGNSGANGVMYPAHYPHVVAVAATNQSNQHASFSNTGSQIALSAPGVLIYSTTRGGYGYLSGTSMSTPFVSGLAAILRGIPGVAAPDGVIYYMEASALDLGAAGRDPVYGYGLIQMDAALASIRPATPTSKPANQGGVNYPSLGVGYASPTPTFTPTPTATLTETPTSTATAVTGTPTPSAGVDAMSAVSLAPSFYRRVRSGMGSDWPLGCGGSLLILLGAWRIAAANHKKGPRYRGAAYFKLR